MVMENARVRRKIPELFEPMMVPHLEKVDEMISPGLTILRWTSLNLESYVDSVTVSLQSLELLIDRATDVWEIQIKGNLEAIQNILLCDLPESDPWTPEQFVAKAQVNKLNDYFSPLLLSLYYFNCALHNNYKLSFPLQAMCAKISPQLNTRCEKVEKATHDLITILLPEGLSLEDVTSLELPKSGTTTPATRVSMSRLSILDEEEEDFKPGELTLQREEKKRLELCQEADYLLTHFNKRTQDALLRCTRTTLEAIKRRVTSPSALHYGDFDGDKKKKMDTRPAFKVNLSLAIPNVALRPSLEDIQSSLNEVVQQVLAVHKGVKQWGQGSSQPADLSNPSQAQLAAQSKVLSQPSGVLAAQSGILAATSGVLATASGVLASSMPKDPPKTFFKVIAEHKEIAKLVSMLSSTVSSAKALVTKALDHFKKYEHLWTLDREEHMTKFLESNPGLSEFESEIRRYMELEETIHEEEEVFSVGALALVTGM